MSNDESTLTGPDFAQGVALSELAENDSVLGHSQGEAILLVRREAQLWAVGATCTHYGGPLSEGLVVEGSVRCPWHHACFSLETGVALRAPALDSIMCWRVEQKNGKVYIREKRDEQPLSPTRVADSIQAVVIVGGGAAGNAAAEMLRRDGYNGSITVLSADSSIPYDRPNLSKGYLAGTAPYEYVPLRSLAFYREHRIDLRLNTRVVAIKVDDRCVELADGSLCRYDALLLATGARPVKLDIPGATLPHVHYLRTLADCNAIIDRAKTARRAVVLGASFIGLEVAASLRARNVQVDVIAPDAVPMERILGPQAGAFIRTLHEQRGVNFHLGQTAVSISESRVVLKNGQALDADLVVIGVGVRPVVDLAEEAGLAMDRGVLVDTYLKTSAEGVFAAGDIARWPDPHSGKSIRVEHWVVAERQGQTAARNILGANVAFDLAPFFWTDQYDMSLAYIGHAEHWDHIDIEGSLEARDCALSYIQDGKTLALATIGRDQQSLRTEFEMESLTLSGERQGRQGT
jgi:NADPH-dependent 2,4-dienoyl-CoA reductase/sulfur reductase-like enzyme/nitrite reductase/ring-hydroxylating ferredoxin subunit